MTLYLIRHAADDTLFLGRDGVRSVPLLFAQHDHANEFVGKAAKEHAFFVAADWCVEPVTLSFMQRSEEAEGGAS